MRIRIRADRLFSASALQKLFLSANWMSGQYPDELRESLQGAHLCYTAWDGGRLVGLCSTLADGAMTAYINYLLVLPEYRGKGIGRLLMRLVMQKYQGYRRVILLAEPDKHNFYAHFGFKDDTHSGAMARILQD